MTPRERLQELLDREGITISSLEKKLGLGHKTLSNWEKSDPKATTIKKVADYFCVSPEYLMGWDDTEQERNELLEHLARNEELKAFMMTASKCTPEELRALEGMIRTWKKSLD